MSIEIYKKRPLLGNTIGGLSGPAIKPIALRMVYQVARAVKIPIIGMGGISCWEDAVEFIMAGADCISVGTAALTNPIAPVEIKEGLIRFMNDNKYNTLRDIREGFM